MSRRVEIIAWAVAGGSWATHGVNGLLDGRWVKAALFLTVGLALCLFALSLSPPETSKGEA